MRKLKILNTIKFIGIVVVSLVFLVVFYFMSSWPEVTQPSPAPSDEPAFLVKVDKDTQIALPLCRSSAQNCLEEIEAVWKYAYGGGYSDEEKKLFAVAERVLELEREIKFLEQRKRSLNENVTELTKNNSQLSKSNREIQEQIIKFVERNRFFDIMLSAFIGALVSVGLSYSLSIPNVREKIKNYFFSQTE